MATINEMIYSTITTKIDKSPKYKLELENLGYTLNNTHDWSSYQYWGIETPKGILVISKDYGGNKRLYFTAFPINGATKNKIKLVDFENLISKPIKDRKLPKSSVKQYKELRSDIKSKEWLIDQYQKDIKKMKQQIEEKQKVLNRYEEMVEKKRKEIQELVESKRRNK